MNACDGARKDFRRGLSPMRAEHVKDRWRA